LPRKQGSDRSAVVQDQALEYPPGERLLVAAQRVAGDDVADLHQLVHEALDELGVVLV
jgi:hypothetical protein